MQIATLFEYTRYSYRRGSTDSFDEQEKSFVFSEKTLTVLEELNHSQKFLDTGLNTIRPLNFVGVVRTGDLTIQIFPKLFKNQKDAQDLPVIAGNLLKMLSYTENLPIKEAEIAGLAQEKLDLFEIFIAIFARNLLRTIKTSQKKEYIKRNEELGVIKGKIQFDKYNNPARFHRIPCEYYDFSTDTLMNRTLKFTCSLMARTVSDITTRRTLRSVVDILDQVSSVPVTVPEIERISFNRLNHMFEPYVRMCKIFLSNSTLTLQASNIESFSLLIPMEKLFEDFIAQVLRSDSPFFFGKYVPVLTQKTIGHVVKDEDNNSLFRMRPDLIIGSDPYEAVVDTKYKALDETDRKWGISQADLYQMYAYVSKMHVTKCMLLYPDAIVDYKRDFSFLLPTPDESIEKVTLLIRAVRLSRNLNVPEEWEQFRCELRHIVKPLVRNNQLTLEAIQDISLPKSNA